MVYIGLHSSSGLFELHHQTAPKAMCGVQYVRLAPILRALNELSTEEVTKRIDYPLQIRFLQHFAYSNHNLTRLLEKQFELVRYAASS